MAATAKADKDRHSKNIGDVFINRSVEGDFIGLVYAGDDVWRRLIVTSLRQDAYCVCAIRASR